MSSFVIWVTSLIVPSLVGIVSSRRFFSSGHTLKFNKTFKVWPLVRDNSKGGHTEGFGTEILDLFLKVSLFKCLIWDPEYPSN